MTEPNLIINIVSMLNYDYHLVDYIIKEVVLLGNEMTHDIDLHHEWEIEEVG
jgi:hypothetical protein